MKHTRHTIAAAFTSAAGFYITTRTVLRSMKYYYDYEIYYYSRSTPQHPCFSAGLVLYVPRKETHKGCIDATFTALELATCAKGQNHALCFIHSAL